MNRSFTNRKVLNRTNAPRRRQPLTKKAISAVLCIALLVAIAAASVPTIVYISCEPSTFARDVGILSEAGYSLVEAQPVDMFPMTGKVETVVLLRGVGI